MSLTFCGASVRGFNSSIGWNEQQSSFRCSLVEDLSNGDFFLPPNVGTPVYFSYGSFYFSGLLQKWTRTNSVSGLPTFEVECTDPRQILEGTQIIIGGYRGAVNVANLYNVFGWWENLTGFGTSLYNDSGMPFYKVRDALLTMINDPVGTPYGGSLKYRGFSYSLDLSEIPVPPDYYRVPGPSVSVLEMISMLCEDAGCDYFVEFIPNTYTIKIRTASRINTAPLGVISALQGSGYGVDLIASSAGLESRNETTSAFVVGGEQQNLHLVDETAMASFWGFDIDGNPIIGSGVGYNHTANLNASPVADIVGSTTYTCTVLELLCALDSKETWMTYMNAYKNALSQAIGIFFDVKQDIDIVGQVFADDFVRDDAVAVKAANAAFTENVNIHNIERLYAYVSDYARDYLGKKFLVSIPFTLRAIEPETLRVIESNAVADGGYLPDGSAPLGLPLLIEDQFKTQDGKFEAFARYDPSLNIDFRSISASDYFITQNGIYVKVQVDEMIVYTPSPAVIITVQNPLYSPPAGPFGDLTEVASMLGTGPDDVLELNETIAGGTGLPKIHPLPLNPTQVAVPLRSNIATYGPWYAQGAIGKVRFEQDSTLVPWQYGGYDFMNQAGLAKVTNALTYLQEVETGSLEYVGAPRWSLGDLLDGSGPNITSIDVSYGAQGVTTIYRMTTFSPRFGVFSKDNAKRLEKMGRLNADLRKSLRAAINNRIAYQGVVNAAIGGAIANIVKPASMSRRSPHTTLLGIIKTDESGKNRSAVSTATFQEVCSGNGGNKDEVWQNTAVMSLDGLLRPFSTNPNNTTMSKMINPGVHTNTDSVNSVTYNPFTHSSDFSTLAKGTTYEGMNQYKYEGSGEIRAMALRGPIVISGWGYAIDGTKVPGGASFTTDYMKKSKSWKTGPVDLLWDEYRGVWTCHDILTGTLGATEIPANGSGTFNVRIGNNFTGQTLTVLNWFNTVIPAGKNAIIGYVANKGAWYVMAVDCN